MFHLMYCVLLDTPVPIWHQEQILKKINAIHTVALIYFLSGQWLSVLKYLWDELNLINLVIFLVSVGFPRVVKMLYDFHLHGFWRIDIASGRFFGRARVLYLLIWRLKSVEIDLTSILRPWQMFSLIIEPVSYRWPSRLSLKDYWIINKWSGGCIWHITQGKLDGISKHYRALLGVCHI